MSINDLGISPNAPIFDALDDVTYYWKQYVESTTISAQAAAFEHLSNAMSDLTSFHPNWNYETGEVERPDD